MNILKIKSTEVGPTAKDYIANDRHGVVYCIHSKKTVCVAKPGSVDENDCTERGYEVMEMARSGGTFLLSEGDFGAFHVGIIGNNFIKDFASRLIEKLDEKGLNASWDGNDVLVDGYKVCGLAASVTRHRRQFTVIHVGINTNLDDIKAICTKPMVKIPKGLSEYGITAEEIEQWFLDYCEVNKHKA